MRWLLSPLTCMVFAAAVAFSPISVTPAAAAPMEARVQLHDGKLATADLTRVLLDNLHLKGFELDASSIDMTGLRGATFVKALNAALGDGCNVRVDDDALVLHFDAAKLPHDVRAFKHDVRVFTATAAPDATARQRRFYGLLMPQQVNPDRRMVVLVHGLDCNRTNWYPMAELLIGQGYQVAYFTYPSDGPIEESAAMLAREMRGVREEFPAMPLDIVAHSMGGLVARGYVEGDGYAGGVEHLILLGTPNLGTTWAAYRIVLEAQEHWALWRHEKDWSPSWMITDGLGEAGRDLKPTSEFLEQLNTRARREGVRYTVIAGAQHPVFTVAAGALSRADKLIPARAAKWWGFRQTDAALRRGAQKMRSHVGTSDGPVNVSSTRLQGVDDVTTLPCDHTALYYPENGNPPAAWDIIRDRLSR
jgi:pimeloyl-ACP methyl ester carboxylesterase